MPSRFAYPPDPGNRWLGTFSLSANAKTGMVEIYYKLSENRWSDAQDLTDTEDLAEAGIDITQRKPFKLLEAGEKRDILTIFPRITFPGDQFLQAKYDDIASISLEGFQLGYPHSPEDMEEFLSSLPKGFIKDPEYGLGLLKDYRYIIDAIRRVSGVKHVCISRQRHTHIDGGSYVLKFSQYDALRRAIDSTHRKAVQSAADEKRILAHNSLLSQLDPSRYPEERQKYAKGTVYRVVEAGAGESIPESDQLAAVSLVAQNKRRLSKSHPGKLLALKREIELVTLDQLIERMHSSFGKGTPEGKWQKFFTDSPFVLTLAFALPVVVIAGQVSVGGGTFSGTGGKITDFLVKNGLTDNLALVEIKTPGTPLLGKEYREGSFAASRELVGCLAQILDQRHKIQAELSALKVNSRVFNIEAYAVRCLIIAGTSPDTLERKKSLELFRNSLHDVVVITFDELLEKLRQLRNFLSSTPA